MSVIKQTNVKTSCHKMKLNIERYDSATEVVEKCRTRSITNSRFNDMTKKSYGDGEWYGGVKSYDEALDLLKHGYDATVQDLKKAFKGTVSGTSKRFQFKNSVEGFAPVVPLALMGVPNSMVSMSMRPIKTKVIDVYYDMTVGCGVSSKSILEAGQNLLGAVVELERQGYRFNLYAVQTYTSENSADMLVVKVKSSGQPLDMKRISFPLTHTAYFRVIGFDWYSKVPNGTYREGYGQALGYRLSSSETDELAKQVFGKNAIYISASNIVREDKNYIKEVLENGNSKA